MNKLFTKIAAACVIAAMAIGVGIAIVSNHNNIIAVNAADSVASATVNSDGGKKAWTLLNGGDSIVDVAASAVTSHSSQLRMAANSTLTFTPHSGVSISMKSLEFATNSTTTYMPGAGSTYTVDGGSAVGFTANSSTKESVTFASAASSSIVIKFGNAIRITSLSITYEDSSSPSTDVDVTFTAGTDTGATSVTKSGVTATMTTMNNASYYQIYSGQTATFTSSFGNILKIVITCTAQGTSNYGPGKVGTVNPGSYSYSGYKGTWVGDAASVTFNASAQVRMTSIVVTYASSGSVSPTAISCDAQAIDVIESVNLANEVTFIPANTTETGLSFAIKSGNSYIDLESSGKITGKSHGTAVVTITPSDTTAGATAIDVNIVVSSIAAPGITVGNDYVIYAIDSTNGNYELSSVSGDYGHGTSFTGDIPSCSYVLATENGYYENTVAFKNGSNYLALTSNDSKLFTSSTINANSSWVVTWDSSDNSARIVNTAYPTREILFNYNGGTTRFACYTTGGSQLPISLYPYQNKPLVDFTIQSTIGVYKTGQATIEVTYNPADASDKTLTWTSGDATVATVADGVVTGVAVGTTTITASKVISGTTVSRNCTVTVLDNTTSHRGTAADPFDINDAVNVAKGVLVEDPDGTPINLENSYYISGKITHNVTRTKTTLTFWIGDNDSQVTAETGAFEVYKAAKVYGTALSTKYTADNEVTRDFNVGYYVTVYSTITLYNGTPETSQNVADVIWNNYIEAREYAEAFNTATDAICTTDNTTDLEALELEWSTQSTAYSALSQKAKDVLVDETPSQAANAYATKKCVAQYDWIVGRYELSDFMGRNPASVGRINDSLFAMNSETSTAVIVIVAVTSLTTIGAIFFIKRRKYN
ncbi:Ig-like domain-containing protein [Pseudobutyrivibrio sp.]